MTRACVVHGAGDLRVEDVPDRRPGEAEVEVAVGYGGICGSDLHYWRHGAVGDFQVREPMVLGHEVAGTVIAVGEGVSGPEPGTPVAIHPATVCGTCPECRAGKANLCRNVRYLGSAARFPHVQGGFRRSMVIPAEQVRPLPDGLTLERAVVAEPLSVALHAVSRSGGVEGKRVLVTGAGPIGCLVTAAARARGAEEIVVTDLLDEPLAVARALGATATFRADEAAEDAPNEFDVAIEASGAPAGLGTCMRGVARGGTVVQVGMFPPGEVPFLGNLLVTRGIDLHGAFRFHEEFDVALELLATGLDLQALVTATVPLQQATEAFELAADRSRASKVLLDLEADGQS